VKLYKAADTIRNKFVLPYWAIFFEEIVYGVV
jgi:hypothetical protein